MQPSGIHLCFEEVTIPFMSNFRSSAVELNSAKWNSSLLLGSAKWNPSLLQGIYFLEAKMDYTYLMIKFFSRRSPKAENLLKVE